MEEMIKEYLTVVKEFKPFMPEIVDTILQYESESKRIIKALVDVSCEMKLRAIKKYTEEGLTID
jgi:hypothetical protein